MKRSVDEKLKLCAAVEMWLRRNKSELRILLGAVLLSDGCPIARPLAELLISSEPPFFILIITDDGEPRGVMPDEYERLALYVLIKAVL